MIVRGGVVDGGLVNPEVLPADLPRGRTAGTTRRLIRIPVLIPWIALISATLFLLPGRGAIPPVIESDYSYLLTAADRLLTGHGLTTTPPVAPFQPWSWQRDWAFLTKWPCGYPLIIASVRAVTGATTIQACQWIAVMGCAVAMVGWFALVRRATPPGLTSLLLASVAAGCAVSPSLLVNPSTDLLLLAVMPYVLLLVASVMDDRNSLQRAGSSSGSGASTGAFSARRRATLLALAGILAGGLFWIRYASVFLPAAVTVYLLVVWARRCFVRPSDSPPESHHEPLPESHHEPPPEPRALACANARQPGTQRSDHKAAAHATGTGKSVDQQQHWWTYQRHWEDRWTKHRWQPPVIFLTAVATPILSLLAINYIFGSADSVTEQLNLGTSVGWVFSLELLGTVWTNATSLGFYDYHWYCNWLFAAWPIVAILLVILRNRGPARARRHARHPAGQPIIARSAIIGLSATTLAMLLLMLVATTALFGGKFNYVEMDRYYFPARPLYFVLFAAPLLPLLGRLPRAAACTACLIALSWIALQDWQRPYQRWVQTHAASTAYGQRAQCFGPRADKLYGWLATQANADLVVVSNFHEYIALETGIPALPIPPDPKTLDQWLARIGNARGIARPRVVFVLDPDNRWRDYWIDDPARIVTRFGLDTRIAGHLGDDVRCYVYGT